MGRPPCDRGRKTNEWTALGETRPLANSSILTADGKPSDLSSMVGRTRSKRLPGKPKPERRQGLAKCHREGPTTGCPSPRVGLSFEELHPTTKNIWMKTSLLGDHPTNYNDLLRTAKSEKACSPMLDRGGLDLQTHRRATTTSQPRS